MPYNIDVSEYLLSDGSSQVLVDDVYPFGASNGVAVTDRYLHIGFEQNSASSAHFTDRRIDRADGSVHDVELATIAFGPSLCDLNGVAPDAACASNVCALDESDVAVTLPITNACSLVVDDTWAYYSLPAGFSRVGLRTGIVQTLIPNATALVAAEANGCLYVDAVFTSPGAHIVRIPREP